MYRTGLQEKRNEALAAVLPIVGLVLLLALTVAPLPGSVLLAFLLGAALLTAGMMFFSLGAELAMEPIGHHTGAELTRSRKLRLFLPLAFLLGFLITVSEPDLQVLAGQVPSIPNRVLILSVAAGVGLFLVIALLRMLLGVQLRYVLLGCYALVLLLACLAPAEFLAVAFDAGGVTTGPMTVPFIMAFGLGIAGVRSDRRAEDDSFGLIALSSVGPILAVLVLSLVYRPDSAGYVVPDLSETADTVTLGALFTRALPEYLGEIAVSLLPIVALFALFQLLRLRLNRKTLLRIGVGLVYTYVGLVLFLTGVQVGFMPAGAHLGSTLAALPGRWVIVPIGMVIGFFIVRAEPAVYVLRKQVEEVTSGAISGTALQRSLSVGVSVSIGLALTRVLTGISILWLVVPGYVLALILSLFCPKVFTAIAFDAGGVASGPMTATFLLPFAAGACLAVGGNVVTDAFGVVAMVAMTPLLAIQALGVVSRLKRHAPAPAVLSDALRALPDDAIIEL